MNPYNPFTEADLHEAYAAATGEPSADDEFLREIDEKRRFEERVARRVDDLRVAQAARERLAAESTVVASEGSRSVDLTPYLDGSYQPPQPTIGAAREDGVRLLYPGRWHTLVGLTTAGKSMLACWHVVAEIQAGGSVTYGHFEEGSPAGTLGRLRAMGLTTEQIRKQFRWLDCSKMWTASEWRAELSKRPDESLFCLDGINATCGQHGWVVDKPEAVGAYRALFVTPATNMGAAVLSLGHPVKSRERQGERHGYGASGWLDEVDGIGMRLEANKSTPIRKGHRGHSALYVVKDRYGEVERHGAIASDRESGWYYMGAFTVDNSTDNRIAVEWTVPLTTEPGVMSDKIDKLCEQILYHLVRNGGHFESSTILGSQLAARGVKFDKNDLRPALERLALRSQIDWPPAKSGRSRPGSLINRVVDP